jgi:hypothetical protein
MTTLYRAYDAAERLLYVGITDQHPSDRLAAHASSGWSKYSVRVDLTRYDDHETAAAAELSAISDEDPVWNRAGRPIERHQQWMLAYPDRHADDVSPQELKERLGERRRETDRLIAAALRKIMQEHGFAAPSAAAHAAGDRNESP